MNPIPKWHTKDSARDADTGPLSIEVREALLHAAQWARDTPPLVATITDRLYLQSLGERARSWLAAHADRIALKSAAKLRDPRFEPFHGAAMLIVFGVHAGHEGESADCDIAALNVLLRCSELRLCAFNLGVERLWFDTPEGRRALGLPHDIQTAAGIAILAAPRL